MTPPSLAGGHSNTHYVVCPALHWYKLSFTSKKNPNPNPPHPAKKKPPTTKKYSKAQQHKPKSKQTEKKPQQQTQIKNKATNPRVPKTPSVPQRWDKGAKQ